MDLSRAADRIGARFREAYVARQPTFDQPRHGPHRVFNRDLRVDARHAKDIETIDAETLDTLLAILRQIFRRAAAAIAAGVRRPRATGLGVDHDPRTPALECLRDYL